MSAIKHHYYDETAAMPDLEVHTPDEAIAIAKPKQHHLSSSGYKARRLA